MTVENGFNSDRYEELPENQIGFILRDFKQYTNLVESARRIVELAWDDLSRDSKYYFHPPLYERGAINLRASRFKWWRRLRYRSFKVIGSSQGLVLVDGNKSEYNLNLDSYRFAEFIARRIGGEVLHASLCWAKDPERDHWEWTIYKIRI